MKHQPKISFCTTCKGRAHHLKKTLIKNLKDNADYPNAEFVILDYNSEDDLGEWVRNNLQTELLLGRVVYYRNPEPEYFHMAHAKNMAHRLGTGDILCNLDADNFTGKGFATYIAKKFKEAEEEGEHIFLRARKNHKGPGKNLGDKMPTGCGGRIAVTRQAFQLAGGYDEKFEKWSPDDDDFANRLKNLGFERRGIKKEKHLTAIGHDNRERWKNYKPDPEFNRRELEKQWKLDGRKDFTLVNDGHVGEGTVYRNFSSEPTVLGSIPTRIFGIGMHKTATTSLDAALQTLGIDSAHWETDKWAKQIRDEMIAGEGRSPTLERHYAVSDFPIATRYKEIDKAYPGSKFILTIRDEDEWLRSAQKHWKKYKKGWDRKPGDPSNEIHSDVYGITHFDESIFRECYRRHNREVLEYFKDRPDDLLVMDMSKGAGWPELCGFLKHPIPDKPYPKKFVTAERERRKVDDGGQKWAWKAA